MLHQAGSRHFSLLGRIHFQKIRQYDALGSRFERHLLYIVDFRQDIEIGIIFGLRLYVFGLRRLLPHYLRLRDDHLLGARQPFVQHRRPAYREGNGTAFHDSVEAKGMVGHQRQGAQRRRKGILFQHSLEPFALLRSEGLGVIHHSIKPFLFHAVFLSFLLPIACSKNVQNFNSQHRNLILQMYKLFFNRRKKEFIFHHIYRIISIL